MIARVVGWLARSSCLRSFRMIDKDPSGSTNPIQLTLRNGVRLEPAVQCTPFLEAATTFCQHCPQEWCALDGGFKSDAIPERQLNRIQQTCVGLSV
jgi:hypothetical protein